MSLDGARVVVLGGTSGIGFEEPRAWRRLQARESPPRCDQRTVRVPPSQRWAARSPFGTLDMGATWLVRAFFADVGAVDHLVITAGELRFGKVVDTEMAAVKSLMDVIRFLALTTPHDTPYPDVPCSITLFSGRGRAPGRGSERHRRRGARRRVPGTVTGTSACSICVNVVRPGAVDTPLLRRAIPNAERSSRRRACSPGRPHRHAGRCRRGGAVPDDQHLYDRCGAASRRRGSLTAR